LYVYQIRSQQAPPKAYVGQAVLNNLITYDKILQVHLEKFPRFKAGDRVRFKKPKRNPIHGTITHVERDWRKVRFTHGVPNFLTVHLDSKNVINGVEEIQTNGKKLLYIGNIYAKDHCST